MKTDEIEKTLINAGVNNFYETELRTFIANWMPERNQDYQQEYFLNDLNRAITELFETIKPRLCPELEYQLQQFREIEKDHFDENGKAYKLYISTILCEQMLNLINKLECQIKQNA